MKVVAVERRIVSLPFDMCGPPASFAGKPWTHLDILLVRTILHAVHLLGRSLLEA